MMYKRLILGEEQKLIPRGPSPEVLEAMRRLDESKKH